MTPVATVTHHHSSKNFLIVCLLAGFAAFAGQVTGAALAIFVLGDQYTIPLSMTFGLVGIIGAAVMLRPSGLEIPLRGDRFSLKKFAGWMVVAVAMLAGQAIYESIASIGRESALLEQAVEFHQYSLLVQVGIVASIALFGPITEEIIFRYLVIDAFTVNAGRLWVWVGSVLSIVLFTISHNQYLNLSSFIFIGAYAIILTLARLHTGGIAMPLMMHVLNNSLSCYAMVMYSPD